MPRDANGFLKPDALRAGVPDQYAVMRHGQRHAVSIVHDDSLGGYATVYRITEKDGAFEERSYLVGPNLSEARARFKKIVASLGGKA